MNEKLSSSEASESRFMSLDFFRGMTMFFLIAEATEIYDHLIDPALKGTLVENLGMHFHHHPWNGLRFWDLIQPFFMFIVGVAMPFSAGDGNGARAGQQLLATRSSDRCFYFCSALGCIVLVPDI